MIPPPDMSAYTQAANAYVAPTNYAPTYGYGWGALKLDAILRFDNSTFNLFVRETVTLKQGDFVDFCFLVPNDVSNLTDSNGFRATIVWSDPPADIMADAMLVNNLVSDSVCACACVCVHKYHHAST